MIEAPPHESALSDEIQQMLLESVQPGFDLLVDFGAGAGDRIPFLLERAPQATVIACDPWVGDWVTSISGESSSTYDQFLTRFWSHRDRLTAMRGSLSSCLSMFIDSRLQPDWIFWDGSRDYDTIRQVVLRILPIFPEANLVGTGWDWPGVERN
jgi:hypothetical protein